MATPSLPPHNKPSVPILQTVGVLALAENAIGSNAYKPMDIIRSRKGTMVEIGNTDAEGRLALADGKSQAATESRPHQGIAVLNPNGSLFFPRQP